MKIAAALWLAFAAGAHAGTGTWRCDITTSDGDSIVEPGETATLRLSMDLSPDSRSIDPDTGLEVYGFAAASADVLGIQHWATGQVNWTISPDLIFLTGDLTTKDDVTQDLHGMTAAQSGRSSTGPSGRRDDPIWIADVFWDPLGDYTPREVSGRVAPRTPEGTSWADDEMAVWLMLSAGWDEPGYWTVIGSEFRFDVVPAPSTLGTLGVIAQLVGFRRRRL